LSEPTLVSEQYLLDLEREAFLSLCGEKKTLERIQSVFEGWEPVRNSGGAPNLRFGVNVRTEKS
jgi:3-hydroxyacyl-CoA dehydrogenase